MAPTQTNSDTHSFIPRSSSTSSPTPYIVGGVLALFLLVTIASYFYLRGITTKQKALSYRTSALISSSREKKLRGKAPKKGLMTTNLKNSPVDFKFPADTRSHSFDSICEVGSHANDSDSGTDLGEALTSFLTRSPSLNLNLNLDLPSPPTKSASASTVYHHHYPFLPEQNFHSIYMSSDLALHDSTLAALAAPPPILPVHSKPSPSSARSSNRPLAVLSTSFPEQKHSFDTSSSHSRGSQSQAIRAVSIGDSEWETPSPSYHSQSQPQSQYHYPRSSPLPKLEFFFNSDEHHGSDMLRRW